MRLSVNIVTNSAFIMHSIAETAIIHHSCSLTPYFSQVSVCEDLNINRWLMRMMRLGLSPTSQPQSPSKLSVTPSHSRRTSDCFLGASLKLSPSRGRRFSDSSSLHKGLRFRKSSKLSISNRKGLMASNLNNHFSNKDSNVLLR